MLGAIALSRATVGKMRQNLFWAVGYNTVAFPIAIGLFCPAFGLILRPEIAASSMAGMGVAGSGAPRETIIVAGLAGLVAGSLSMALGEYLSVQSARELFANESAIEERQLAESPDAEVAELREIYERKGVPAPMARDLAEHMVRSDPRLALDTMVRRDHVQDRHPGRNGTSLIGESRGSIMRCASGRLWCRSP